MNIFMYMPYYFPLQDKTGQCSTQADQERIHELLNNNQQIVDHNPQREQQIAQSKYKWIEERQRCSCIVLAPRTLRIRGWRGNILKPRLATTTLSTLLMLTRRLTIVCANVVAVWRVASLGDLVLSKAITCLVEATMAVTIWLTWPTIASWATALSAADEVGLIVALVLST